LPSGGSANTKGALQFGQVRLRLVIMINFVLAGPFRPFQMELGEWKIFLSTTDEKTRPSRSIGLGHWF
jgi:hypothetical protein